MAESERDCFGAHRQALLTAAPATCSRSVAAPEQTCGSITAVCAPSRSPSRRSRWSAAWTSTSENRSPTRRSCAPRRRICRSTTRASTSSYRHSCSAPSTTSLARCGKCSVCCAPAGTAVHRARALRRRKARALAGPASPLNARLMHGCHCNRPTLDGIRAAGFEVTQVDHSTIPHAPPFARPLIVGVAERPAA